MKKQTVEKVTFIYDSERDKLDGENSSDTEMTPMKT